MKLWDKIRNAPLRLLLPAVIYGWLTVLSPVAKTDAYFSVYLLWAVAALACWLSPGEATLPRDRRSRRLLSAFSCGFSLAVVLANYALLEPMGLLETTGALLILLPGGVAVAWPLLDRLLRLSLSASRENVHPWRVFWVSFGVIALTNLGHLVSAQYPGVLTRDSLSTVNQILGNSDWNNVMPYWHTRLVGIFFHLGYGVNQDINLAVATVHAAQILFMAGCVAYAMMTLWQVGLPRWALGLAFAFWWLVPYHILYSVTLWKDVPFAGAILLFATALYRILRRVGPPRWWDWVLLTLGGAGFALMRTNGWYSCAVTVVLLLLLMGKGQRRLKALLVGIVVVSWVMLNPLLDLWGVRGLDYTEALAIPMQQLSRVVAQERPLTQEETELLEIAFDLDQVRELYNPISVDPIKFGPFRRGNLGYLQENIGAYLKLYLRLGLRYPMDYLKAWIDETKGYWNGGYYYWIYTRQMEGQELGLVRQAPIPLLAKGYYALTRIWEKASILQFSGSIGWFVWLVLACFTVNLARRGKERLIFLPFLVVLVGLWIGTPVYAEFRYAYPIVLATPFLAGITTCGAQGESEGEAI